MEVLIDGLHLIILSLKSQYIKLCIHTYTFPDYYEEKQTSLAKYLYKINDVNKQYKLILRINTHN